MPVPHPPCQPDLTCTVDVEPGKRLLWSVGAWYVTNVVAGFVGGVLAWWLLC
jgi:hypothetical protein